MSILIKGMQMPDSCWNCPVDKPLCTLWQGMTTDEMDVGRHDDCPLIELPPHGLIDKQMLLRNISENQFTNSYVGHEDEYAFWDKVWDYIINAPTIIESEREE